MHTLTLNLELLQHALQGKAAENVVVCNQHFYPAIRWSLAHPWTLFLPRRRPFFLFFQRLLQVRYWVHFVFGLHSDSVAKHR